jgi:hypothetical protein
MSRIFKVGVFSDEHAFMSSISRLQEHGITIYDVYTPYPIHEVFHLLKVKSRLPMAAYFFGLFGMLAVLGFLYYTSVIDWPINYGGKPFNSFPSFIVITLVLTILTVTILGLAAFSARSKLVPGRENTIFHERATNDKFVIVVETGTISPELSGKAENLMKEGGAEEISIREFEKVYA